MVLGYSLPFCLWFAGGLHRGRDVCSEGEEGSCNAGGFRDGGGQDHEKGDWEEHVPKEAVEVTWQCLPNVPRRYRLRIELLSVSSSFTSGLFPASAYAFLLVVIYKCQRKNFFLFKSDMAFMMPFMWIALFVSPESELIFFNTMTMIRNLSIKLRNVHLMHVSGYLQKDTNQHFWSID